MILLKWANIYQNHNRKYYKNFWSSFLKNTILWEWYVNRIRMFFIYKSVYKYDNCPIIKMHSSITIFEAWDYWLSFFSIFEKWRQRPTWEQTQSASGHIRQPSDTSARCLMHQPGVRYISYAFNTSARRPQHQLRVQYISKSSVA